MLRKLMHMETRAKKTLRIIYTLLGSPPLWRFGDSLILPDPTRNHARIGIRGPIDRRLHATGATEHSALRGRSSIQRAGGSRTARDPGRPPRRRHPFSLAPARGARPAEIFLGTGCQRRPSASCTRLSIFGSTIAVTLNPSPLPSLLSLIRLNCWGQTRPSLRLQRN